MLASSALAPDAAAIADMALDLDKASDINWRVDLSSVCTGKMNDTTNDPSQKKKVTNGGNTSI